MVKIFIITRFKLVNKQLYSWGTAIYNELGIDGISYTNIPTPIKTSKCSLVSKVKCGPNYTALIDYNGSIFYFGKIFEKRIPRSSYMYNSNNCTDNSDQNSMYVDNSVTDSSNLFIHIENINARDIFCGVNLIAIIDIFGNLYIYNEVEKLCKIKLNKPVDSVKFINSDFYAISKDKNTLIECMHKGANFSFLNYFEKNYAIDSDINNRMTMLDLPYYNNLLFFMLECTPYKKEEIELKEKKVFNLIRHKRKEEKEIFYTDDESNASSLKVPLCITNIKSNLSRLSRNSASISKMDGNYSMQHSNFEDVSVLPPNRVKSQQKRSYRESSLQSERSSKISSNNTRINKISDLLGKIFNRKLSQITSLNYNNLNTKGHKKSIDIERLPDIATITAEQAESIKKNEISISKNNLSNLSQNFSNSPKDFQNSKKIKDKNYILSPYSHQADNKSKKINLKQTNEYKKIVKKLNFSNFNEIESESSNKINIIKLEFGKIDKFEKSENLNDISSINSSNVEAVSFRMKQSENKKGFDTESIKVCRLSDNNINLNVKDKDKDKDRDESQSRMESHITKQTIDRVEMSILSNREQMAIKESDETRYNSNGKSKTNKHNNENYSCDVSHVSNGKPDINSRTEEIAEANSEVLNLTSKETENDSPLRNIVSDSFNFQIKEIFSDDHVNIGNCAESTEIFKNKKFDADICELSSTFYDPNRFRRNKQNKFPNQNEIRNEFCMNSDFINMQKNLNAAEKDGTEAYTIPAIINTPELNFNLSKNNQTNGNVYNNLDLVKTSLENEQNNIDIIENNLKFSFSSRFMLSHKQTDENLNLGYNPSEILKSREIIVPMNETVPNNKTPSMNNGKQSIDRFGNDTSNDILDKFSFCENKNNSISRNDHHEETSNCDPKESNCYNNKSMSYRSEPHSISNAHIPQSLYKRKSSISSFKTAKRENKSNTPCILNEDSNEKGIIISYKNRYSNCLDNLKNEEIKPFIVKEKSSLSSIKENSCIMSEHQINTPAIIIKKIVEMKNTSKAEIDVESCTNLKLYKPDFNGYHSKTENFIMNHSNETIAKGDSKDQNNHQESTVLISSLKKDNQSTMMETESTFQDPNKRAKKLPDSSLGRAVSSCTDINLSQNQDNLETSIRDKNSTVKVVLVKPLFATNEPTKFVLPGQNINEQSKPNLNSGGNIYNTTNLKVIDIIKEEEAYKENSFYNPNNSSEEKIKKELITNDHPNTEKRSDIFIEEKVHPQSHYDNNKINTSSGAYFNFINTMKIKENKIILNDLKNPIEPIKAKEHQKAFIASTPTTKIQLNTITSIIHNSKKNSPNVNPVTSYSIFAKMKDSVSPNLTKNLDQNKSDIESNIVDISTSKVKTLDLKAIKLMKNHDHTQIPPFSPHTSNHKGNALNTNNSSNRKCSVNEKNFKRNSNAEISSKDSGNPDVSCISSISNYGVMSNINKATNLTQIIDPINNSQFTKNESKEINNKEKILEKSNTHKIISLKIKQEGKTKNVQKQIKINYLKSPDVSDFIQLQNSKTGTSFNKRNTIDDKSRKSSILSKVKTSASQYNTSTIKNKRSSVSDFNSQRNVVKKTESIIKGDELNRTPSNKIVNHDEDYISPHTINNKFDINFNKIFFGSDSFENIEKTPNRVNCLKEEDIIINDKYDEPNYSIFKHMKNPIMSIDDEINHNINCESEIKLSNFNLKTSDNKNMRYSNSSIEPDNESMTKYLKDLYEGYKQKKDNKFKNFEEYVQNLISCHEEGHDKKGDDKFVDFSSEIDNFKSLEKEEKFKNYLKSKLKEGNISPKLTFCLTPIRYINEEDYKDKTSKIFFKL